MRLIALSTYHVCVQLYCTATQFRFDDRGGVAGLQLWAPGVETDFLPEDETDFLPHTQKRVQIS